MEEDYDHTKEEVLEACNIDNDRLNRKKEEFKQKLSEMFESDEDLTRSKIVELQEEIYTKRELSILLEQTVNKMEHMIEGLMKQGMQMKGGGEEDKSYDPKEYDGMAFQ